MHHIRTRRPGPIWEKTGAVHQPSVPSSEFLRDLLPVVERSLERHLSAAKEWFPHEFVPYEEGRNFVEGAMAT